jgi:hypothetical protein
MQILNKFKNIMIEYFFKGQDPRNIAIGRILFYFYLIDYFWGVKHQERFLKFHDVPELFWQPISLFKLLPLESIYIFNNVFFLYLMFLAFFMSAIGLFTRIFIPLSFVLSFIFIGFPNNYGTVFDSTCMVTLVLGLLCFARSGDFYSLDSLIAKYYKRNLNPQISNIWFLNIVPALLMFFYFCAGVQKIIHGGWDFFSSDNLSIALVYNQASIGPYLANFPILCLIGSYSIVALQLLTIIPILFKKYILQFALVYLLFHTTVDITMTKHFSLLKICYFFIFPWHLFKADINLVLYKIKTIIPNYYIKSFAKKAMISYLALSILIFTGAISAVMTTTHLWPFSTATMYAFTDNFPFKQKDIYLIKENHEYLVKSKDSFPIGNTKLRVTINNLINQGISVEKIGTEVKSFLVSNIKEDYERLEIRECVYKDLEYLQEHYPKSKSCKTITTIPF